MDHITEKVWVTESGLKACVILSRFPNGKSVQPTLTEVLEGKPMGQVIQEKQYRCGYVRVPNKKIARMTKQTQTMSLRETFERSIDCIDVHGGVTWAQYSRSFPIKSWLKRMWIGFDCAHATDSVKHCTLYYCMEQCESMAKQIVKY